QLQKASLLAAGASTRDVQMADFWELVKSGTAQEVQAASKNGADLEAQDKDGGTVLMSAAVHNPNLAVITTLLKAGADPKAQDKDGMTPLMHAAEKNPDPKVITTLLKAGADAKARDNAGNTAFDY